VQLDTVTIAAFAPHVGTELRVDHGEDAPLVIRLTEVRAAGRQPGAPRQEPFVLVFEGPVAPILPQATYTLEHDTLGSVDIFLVPVGRHPDGGIQYEAVFN
jgi:hypothetical protein